jgi:hypothetical protein
LFSTLFGFIVNLDLDFGFVPTLENLHLGYRFSSIRLITTFITVLSMFRNNLGTLFKAKVVPKEMIDSCRYHYLESTTVEMRYQGKDLHFHSAIQHYSLFEEPNESTNLLGISLEFCYETYKTPPNDLLPKILLRRIEFPKVPHAIHFRQLDPKGQPFDEVKDLGQLYNEWNQTVPALNWEHHGKYHVRSEDLCQVMAVESVMCPPELSTCIQR